MRWILTFAASAILHPLFAQEPLSGDGFTVGRARITTDANIGVSHDNRVLRDANGEYQEDLYVQAEAGVQIENLPARYRGLVRGRYGYRAHSEYSIVDNDFYSGVASLKTGEGALRLGLSTDYSKALDYRITYNPAGGEVPDAVLVDIPNIRWKSKANAGYEWRFSDRVGIMPMYELNHYLQQEADGLETDIAEWQIHRVLLETTYFYSDKTRFGLGGAYSLQVNDAENGKISTVYVRGESQTSDKTDLDISLGLSAANYEESGSDAGVVSDARFTWKSTEKISTYVFGGNRFLPGYAGGGARMVYRAGYGAGWRFLSRWNLGGEGLHSYEREVVDQNMNAYGGVVHFFNLRCGYDLTKNIAISAGWAYRKDRIDPDKMVTSLKISVTY